MSRKRERGSRRKGRERRRRSSFSWKAYYEEKKEEIAEKKKKRYETDPAYRESLKEASKEAYEAKRKSKDRVKSKYLTFTTKNGEKFYSVSVMADFIGKSVASIHVYHRNGILPLPKRKDSRGWRLYSEHELNVAKKYFAMFDQRELQSLAEVGKKVREEWDGNDE